MLEVGQQFADGQIVVVSSNDDGSVTVAFPLISNGPGGGATSININPNTTVSALESILTALKS